MVLNHIHIVVFLDFHRPHLYKNDFQLTCDMELVPVTIFISNPSVVWATGIQLLHDDDRQKCINILQWNFWVITSSKVIYTGTYSSNSTHQSTHRIFHLISHKLAVIIIPNCQELGSIHLSLIQCSWH